jgi:hypothetical protein
MIEKHTFSEPQPDWGIGGTLEARLDEVYPKPEADADGSPAWVPIEKLRFGCEKKILSVLRPAASARRKGPFHAVVSRALYCARLQRPVPRQPVAISLRLETAGAPGGLSDIRQRQT